MKIIDLLNKIANREEVPKKIKYKNKIYEWKEYDAWYGKIMTKKGWVKEYGYVAEENRTYFYLKHCYQDLNDEVEILEEEKKSLNDIRESYGLPRIEEKKIPEKLPYYSLEKIQKAKNKDEWREERISLLEKRVEDLHIKMNELLDYLKSKGE